MSKFTPGPWAVNPFKATVDECDDRGPLPICAMLWPTDRRSEAETEANACLIAASTDMYDALQDALKVAEFEHHPWRPWHDVAKQAIAKADGPRGG